MGFSFERLCGKLGKQGEEAKTKRKEELKRREQRWTRKRLGHWHQTITVPKFVSPWSTKSDKKAKKFQTFAEICLFADILKFPKVDQNDKHASSTRFHFFLTFFSLFDLLTCINNNELRQSIPWLPVWAVFLYEPLANVTFIASLFFCASLLFFYAIFPDMKSIVNAFVRCPCCWCFFSVT